MEDSSQKKLPEPHDMQLPMSHWQRLPPPTFWEKHRNLPKILILGIVLICIALVTALFMKNPFQAANDKQKITKGDTTPTATPLPEPTTPQPFPTTTIPVNWKTYDAFELRISFRYPPDWFVDTTNGPEYLRVQNYDPKTAPGRSSDPTADKEKYLTVIRTDDSIQAKNNTELQNTLASQALANTNNLGPAVILNEKSFTINGYTAYQREVRYPNSPMNEGMETYILDGNGKNVIVSPGLDVKGGKTYYDQILSTLTFTNTLATDEDTPENKAKMINLVKEDLAKKLQKTASAITVVGSEYIGWPNSALGCGSGNSLSVIVFGYKVVVSAGQKTYEYHTDTNNLIKDCTNL